MKREEGVDHNDAYIAINVHPHCERWHPAGTAVSQYHQNNIIFIVRFLYYLKRI